MRKIYLLLAAFAGIAISAQAESTVWSDFWDVNLLPPNLPDKSGMDAAKRQFSFMNDPYSVGYYEFLLQAAKMMDNEYKSVMSEGWIYGLAVQINEQLKRESVNPTDRSPIATGVSDEDEPMVQIISREIWLADPTSRDYLDFMDFGDEIMLDRDSSLQSALEQFSKYRLGLPPYNSVQRSVGGRPAPQVVPSSGGSLTVEEILARRKAEEEEARVRRQTANQNNKARIAARKEEELRLKEAARSRPRVHINVN